MRLLPPVGPISEPELHRDWAPSLDLNVRFTGKCR